MWWSQTKTGNIDASNPIEQRSYTNTDTVLDRLEKGKKRKQIRKHTKLIDTSNG